MQEAKTDKFGMLEFVPPVALLKSTRQVKEIHGAEIWEFVEKKLMDSGGHAVYPSQPFRYGYKRVYPNKKDLIKNPIGIRAPLTDEQLKMVAEFVGLAKLKECNADTKYLRILKSLLVQRCNIQNPDELDWNDILAHIEVFLCKTEQKTKFSKNDKTRNIEAKPAQAIENQNQQEQLQTRHSPDFRSVIWFGTRHYFTPTQAAIVKFLWKAWENGTPDMGHETLLEEAGSESNRLVDVFKGHKTYKKLIGKGETKGSYRLIEPGK